MPNFLEQLENSRTSFNEVIKNKLENGIALTDDEAMAYELTEDDNRVLEYFSKVVNGEDVPGFSIKNFLASPQAKVLIPKIIIGAAKKAQDPIYLASKFYKKIRLKNGASVQFPSFGVIRAYDIGEGQEIPAENLDWNLYSDSQINVGKCGLRINYSDDLIEETEFDIVGTLTSEAGRAMAR